MVAAIAGTASANPLDIVGLTSRRAAQADAGVAEVDDASAIYYDPAGLAAGMPRAEVLVGFVGAHARLKINDAHAHLADPWGFQLAARTPLPLEGVLDHRIVVGIALHVLPHDVVDIVAPAPDQPYYNYFDRMARLVVMPGAAVALPHGVTVGVAVNILAGLSGSLAANDGATRAIDSRVDEQVGTIARVVAGAQWKVTDRWRVGATYRQRFEVPFGTAATTVVGGEPIDLDIRASELFTPHEVVAGVAHEMRRVRVALDGQWSKWSDYKGPYVQVDSVLPLAGSVPGAQPKVAFKDTFAARLGVESVRAESSPGLIVRAGAAFETSAVPASQPGQSNLLDGNHVTVALGAGWQFPRALAGHDVRVDAHASMIYVTPRTITKALYDGHGDYNPDTSLRDEDPDTAGLQISNPGYPGLKSGGEIFAGGVTIEVGL
jgi:hypothetical protein